LAQQHASRVKQHGQRLYRQSDGSLGAQPAQRQPYTVANRHKWHGLVHHCRQLPGVNPQLERTGDRDVAVKAGALLCVFGERTAATCCSAVMPPQDGQHATASTSPTSSTRRPLQQQVRCCVLARELLWVPPLCRGSLTPLRLFVCFCRSGARV
jgi:hypothetical protein